MASVQVVLRVRSSIDDESPLRICDDNQTVDLWNYRYNDTIRFKFDRCYNSDCDHQEIFQRSIQPLLNHVFDGHNVSIFTYGATGSGKTYTMIGNESDPGLIPMAVNEIFSYTSKQHKLHKNWKYNISMSYLEVYQEKIYDLIASGNKDLNLYQNKSGKIVVGDLAESAICSFEEFCKVFMKGNNGRRVAATKLNRQSSRSHSVLLLKVEKTDNSTLERFNSKVYLIDLAGSEDNRRTGNSGERLKESGTINSSLFVLGKVVEALNQQLARIPYRESKLTRLLQDSIGGSAHSCIITTVSASKSDYYSTYHTLQFASKSRNIINKPFAQIENIKPRHDLSETRKRRISTAEDDKNNKKKKSSEIVHIEHEIGTHDSSPGISSNKCGNDTEIKYQLAEFEKKMLSRQEQQTKALLQCLTNMFPESNSQLDGIRSKVEKELVHALPRVATATKNSRADSINVLNGKENSKFNKRPAGVTKNLSSIALKPIENKLDNLKVHRLYNVNKQALDVKPITCSKKLSDDNTLLDMLRKVDDRTARQIDDLLRILNQGDCKSLTLLNTIGKKKAKAIIDFRNINGEFSDIAGLQKIPCFTPNTVRKFVECNMFSSLDVM